MKILIVGTDFPPSVGGISTYTKELAQCLQKIADVTVLAPGAWRLPEIDRKCTFRIFRTPAFPLLRGFAFFIYIPWLLWRFRFDAVLHTVWPTALVSYLYRPIWSMPYYISVHASEILDDRRNWRRRLKFYLRNWKLSSLQKATAVFPVSRYTAGLVQAFGVPSDRVYVISNGVDTKLFHPADKSRPPYGMGTLLTVARLDLHKGHDFVLKALALLKKEGFTPRYIIAGTGDEEARLRKMATDLDLENQVHFTGFVADEDLPSLYNSADIFVMASREVPGRLDLIEGFGISFLEAAASGLPVIGGNSGGVADAVRDGETGFLVAPDDPEAIAAAIKKLLLDPALAKRLGRTGREWTELEMDWNKVAERLLRVLQSSKM